MKRRIIISIVILIFLAGGIFIYLQFNKSHPSNRKADYIISASILLGEFELNENEANQKYLGKILEVHGLIKDSMDQESTWTLLIGDSAAAGSVSCSFHPENSLTMGSLKNGDSIIVRGECTGMLLDVILTNCEIINPSLP